MNLYGKARRRNLSAGDAAAQFKQNDLRAAQPPGRAMRVVETLEHEDGVDLHHSLVSKFLIPGPDGNSVLVGGMAIDITDLKRAEQVLEESEQQLRQLAENIQEVFWMSDPLKNEILYISPAYETLWGQLHAEPYTSSPVPSSTPSTPRTASA